jgi:hypothetical protein
MQAKAMREEIEQSRDNQDLLRNIFDHGLLLRTKDMPRI